MLPPKDHVTFVLFCSVDNAIETPNIGSLNANVYCWLWPADSGEATLKVRVFELDKISKSDDGTYFAKVSSPSLSNTNPPVVDPVVPCTVTSYLESDPC